LRARSPTNTATAAAQPSAAVRVGFR
jgi:hypothetical protein